MQMLLSELLLGGCSDLFSALFGLFGVDDLSGLKGDVGGVPEDGIAPFKFLRASKELLSSGITQVKVFNNPRPENKILDLCF